MFFFRSGACFLANSATPSGVTVSLFRHSSMNAMLFCRIARLFGFQSSRKAVAASPSSAACMRMRYDRHRWTPALVIWAVDIGGNDLAERHGAVTNRLHKLIVNRHSWSIEWRLAG